MSTSWTKSPEAFSPRSLGNRWRDRRKHPGVRNDFIDILMQHVESEKSSKFATKEDLEKAICSNAFVMFFAGFDTSSTASSLCCYFLAKNPDCQDKLYEEIREAVEENGGNENLDYNIIQKLDYLEQCLFEGLRNYSLLLLERKVTKPYKVPGTDLVMPVGSMVTIPGSSLSKDPKILQRTGKVQS